MSSSIPLPSILLVEDDEVFAGIATEVLEPLGTVTWVATGEEAIAVAPGGDWDLVVTDIELPGIDGIAFLKLLGTQWHDKFFPDLSLLIFVLVLSALAVARQYVAQTELVQLRDRLRTIVESVADGIVTFSERGRIIWVNPAAEAAFQVEAGELEGEPVDALFHGVTWQEMAPLLGVGAGAGATVLGERRTLTGERRDGETFPLEMVVTDARLDGERVLIAIGQDVGGRERSAVALRESERRFRRIFDHSGVGIAFSAFEDGVPLFAVGMLEDVSSRKEAERVKDELVSVAGHELRTPLTSTGMLGTAISSTERLVRLINDILDIERMDSGRAEIEVASVSASELVELSTQAEAPSTSPSRARGMMPSSPSAMPVGGSRRTRSSRSSSASTRSIPPTRGRRAAPGSAWRSRSG